MQKLTCGDVLEIIGPLGITAKVFRGWCDQGLVTPAEGGAGPGDHRTFLVMQAVGLAVAAKVYTGERGCVASFVGKVVEAFSNLTETELLARIKTRGRHFVGPHNGKPWLQTDTRFGWVDVEQTYHEVVTKVVEIQKRLGQQTAAGRVRGLASKS